MFTWDWSEHYYSAVWSFFSELTGAARVTLKEADDRGVAPGTFNKLLQRNLPYKSTTGHEL